MLLYYSITKYNANSVFCERDSSGTTCRACAAGDGADSPTARVAHQRCACAAARPKISRKKQVILAKHLVLRYRFWWYPLFY
jgi:hypothetical protein